MPSLPAYFPLTTLESLPIFRDLTPLQLETARCVLEWQEYEPGQLLMTPQAQVDIIYLIVEGAVKISLPHQQEGDIILTIAGRGEIIGAMAMLDAEFASINVNTVTHCVLGAVTRSNFWNVLWQIPAIPFNFACFLGRRVKHLSEHSHAFALLDIQSRLARQIVMLGEMHGYELPNDSVEIPFRLTQEEWAQLVGASRAQINQILMKWRRQHWIEIEPDRIIINQLNALRGVCNEFER